MLETIFQLFKILCRPKVLGSTPAPESLNTIFSRSLWCTWVTLRQPISSSFLHTSGTASREERSTFALATQDSREILIQTQLRVCELYLSALHSDRELGSSAATVGQQQQAPQTQACEWIAPQQGGRTSKYCFHTIPPQATLPCGLFIFKTFNFLQDIQTTVNKELLTVLFTVN